MSPRRTILVVEDNPMTRKMLRVTLESGGYQVVEAADGRTALAAATQGMPGLVLQDLVLPDMNGLELLRQLRALPRGAETPIVALSGFLGRLEDANAEHAGFTALLVKPIEPSRLLDAVRGYFPAEIPAVTPSAERRRVLLVDDDPVQLKLARVHLEQAGFEVGTSATAVEALRAARAHLPDVIVSDVLMPDVDGFQLCFEARQDPALARVPVVLVSAWYRSHADEELAARVGANALVTRSPDLKEVIVEIRGAMAAGAPTVSEAASTEVKLEHAKVVIRQLEKQLALGADLTRRCTLQAAQISLLGGVADALTRRADSDAALRDVLSATLDAAGISKGALFLRDGGALALRQAIGFSAEELEPLAGFFGHLDLLDALVKRQVTVSLPSPDLPEAATQAILTGASSVTIQIVPLVSDGHGAGAIVLAARRTDVTNEDAIAFARAMGNQVAQSLELGASFTRLAASEERYRSVTENANDAIFVLTVQGNVLEVNRAGAQLFGRSKEQIVGRHVRDFAAAGHEEENVSGYNELVAAGSGRSAPVPIGKPDGSTVLVEFSHTALDIAGQPVVLSIGRDVTDSVKGQTQLMVSDRMASVGALAAGVAHEINNPLAVTTANLDYALKEVAILAERFGRSEVASLQESLQDATEAAYRVRTLVRDLKIFSRAEEDKRGPVDLPRVLESTLRMAWNEIRHRAQLVKSYEEVPQVEANESRLGQVFLNLVINAAQAIPEGHAQANEIRVGLRMDPSGRVAVDIADTGPGMPPEVLRRLFTPFFTTKPVGVGTGLGLSICHGIISGLGGEIVVESTLGRGSVFRVVLPAARSTVTVPVPTTTVPTARRGRLLIIDDEALVGAALQRMLRRHHDVVVVTSAHEGLDRILEGEAFDVIVCDVMMPVMTGEELFLELEAKAPALARKIIFLTGGAFTVRAREFLDRVPNERLEKPVDLDTLLAAVNKRILDPLGS